MSSVDPIRDPNPRDVVSADLSLKQRQTELVTKTVRPKRDLQTDRARMEQELLALKADTEQQLTVRKLEEEGAPLSDTCVKFSSDIVRLRGDHRCEIFEEVSRYDLMRCVVAFWKINKLLKIFNPRGVVVDENTGQYCC